MINHRGDFFKTSNALFLKNDKDIFDFYDFVKNNTTT